MNTTETPGRWALGVAFLIFATGCSTSVEPEDPEPVYHEVQLNLWRMEVEGDCDDDFIIGNAGEFSFEVTIIYEEDEESAWTAEDVVATTTLYGNPDGESVKISDGENHQFENGDSAQFEILDGLRYQIDFSVTEWDGKDADTRMDDRVASLTITADGTGGEISMPTGARSDCRVQLKGLLVEGPANP